MQVFLCFANSISFLILAFLSFVIMLDELSALVDFAFNGPSHPPVRHSLVLASSGSVVAHFLSRLIHLTLPLSLFLFD